jgi:hypothetical protein
MRVEIKVNNSWQPLFNNAIHNVEQCLKHWCSFRGFSVIRVTNESGRILFEGDARDWKE